MKNVYHTKEDMIACVNSFYEGMVSRSEEMKQHPNYKTGENYAYLGLAPHFLIFDEYVAFFEMLGAKESMNLLSQLKKIVMLGRQAGYFSLWHVKDRTQSILQMEYAITLIFVLV